MALVAGDFRIVLAHDTEGQVLQEKGATSS